MSTIIGLDPGLATCGIAVVELTSCGWSLCDLQVMTTAKSAKKLNVLSAADTLRRARELSDCLADQFATARLVAAERFSPPRDAGAASKVAMAWGVIAALAEIYRLPVVQPSPQEVKKALCGRQTASKEDVEAACRGRLRGGAEVVGAFEQTYPRGMREHAWDALAVVLASLDSDLVRAIRPEPIDGRHGVAEV